MFIHATPLLNGGFPGPSLYYKTEIFSKKGMIILEKEKRSDNWKCFLPICNFFLMLKENHSFTICD
jgi:hypothetical protein